MEELGNERDWHEHVERAARTHAVQASESRERTGSAGADAFALAALAVHAATRATEAAAHALAGEHFVGRIDDASGEAIYVGRHLVRDTTEERPVSHRSVVDGIAVVNWQVPAAKPFYTARPGGDEGVVRRRRFTFRAGTIDSYSDEHFVVDAREAMTLQAEQGAPRVPVVSPTRGQGGAKLQVSPGPGDDLLLAELSRGRESHMRDIVATIQAEQYELMERPGPGVLVVQGAPGTGKTAVALHRLSMLLVRDTRLSRTGTLLIGPSVQFLDYVARVLPSLGDVSVDQRTIKSLGPGSPALDPEPSVVGSIKGDARMAHVLRRAVHLQVKMPDRPLVLELAGNRLAVSRGELAEIFHAVQSEGRTQDQRRQSLLARVVSKLSDKYIAAIGGPSRLKFSGLQDPISALESLPAILDLVGTAIPQVTAETILTDLWTKSEFLLRAADGILEQSEIEQLWSWVDREWERDRTRTSGARWAPGDLPLLDELSSLLARDATARRWGHIAVDEAQDLTPMQLRLIGRLVATGGGVTLLGDLAQASGPWTPISWRDVASHLAVGGNLTLAELRMGFRLPSRVLEVANTILPHTGADVPPGVAVRDLPDALTDIVALTPADAVERSVDLALRRANTGLTALIGASTTLARIPGPGRQALAAAGVGLFEPHEAKGLEFDHVVATEPENIVASAPSQESGARLLYVAVTRATKTLTIVRSAAMPFDAVGGAVGKTPEETNEGSDYQGAVRERRWGMTSFFSRGRPL